MPRVSKEKNAEYQRKWYAQNQELQKQRNRDRNETLRAWLRELKSTLCCTQCGENHPATLEFHHRDPSQKDRNVAAMMRDGCGKKKIQAEIEKCDVLCSNCHRKHHYDED